MKMLAAAPTVLLVEPDDYRLRRHTLELLHDTEFHLIAAVNSRRTAVPVIQREKIDLAVVNVRLPDGSGAEITREILRRNPQAHVLIATDVSEENTVMQAVEAGADGYLLFDDNTPSIAASLKVMQSDGSPVSPLIARSVLRALHNRNTPERETAGGLLSRRELDILQLLAKGLAFAAIGEVLAISEHTVTTHVKKLYKKLNVHSRGEAVYEARELNLIR